VPYPADSLQREHFIRDKSYLYPQIQLSSLHISVSEPNRSIAIPSGQ